MPVPGVANAAYVAQRTGSDAVGVFLVDTGGQKTTAVVRQLQTRLGPAATLTEIAHTRTPRRLQCHRG
ncbi:hypothetical protein [Amycolatopsis saalfeldensis]|uniref:Putative ABC transport system permease protein n=1 Tax=Amycolatopsis saalfeldensis TaxID=394193 RepID=A0A1H8YN15_9PSEU|nr:hypothetical protein [Amycolatopsis saalfeldensis]SEP53556.1 putative ABC transport system permease protein [Amycolatopsis saalfeldensis]